MNIATELISRPKQLTKVANKAIYIDFEGLGTPTGADEAPDPSLLGVVTSGHYTAFIHDEDMHHAARGRARNRFGLACAARRFGLEAALLGTVVQAEMQDRYIVHYSCHEKEMIAQALGDDHPLYERFLERQLDAKDVLKKASGRGLIERPETHSLVDYASILEPGYVPHRLSEKAASKIRTVKGQPRADRAQKHLAELLDYNREDCLLMRRCLLEAARVIRGRG